MIFMALILSFLGGAIGSYFMPGNPENGISIGIIIAMIVWILMLLIGLSSGDRILLATAGAREISHDDAPQLYNIVEEMKIAAGLPKIPRIYIIDSSVPNAFAAGIKTDNAAIAVTTGLLARLNRDELQGVIAHEIGHITNRDTYFMTLAGVTVGAVIILADLFMRGMWFSSIGGRRSSRDSGQLQMIILVVGIATAILAPILTQLLYFASSRQREYLADASAARFTRYPEGLASALEKITAHQNEKFSKSRTLAPMYIVNPLASSKNQTNLFSTHPPTEERIRILRGMTSSSSLLAYEQAYRQIHENQSIIGASALKDSEEQGIRQADTTAQNVKKGMRDAKNILQRATGYGILTCACGLKMKIPKVMDHERVKCPRCGKVHEIPPELMGIAAITK